MLHTVISKCHVHANLLICQCDLFFHLENHSFFFLITSKATCRWFHKLYILKKVYLNVVYMANIWLKFTNESQPWSSWSVIILLTDSRFKVQDRYM